MLEEGPITNEERLFIVFKQAIDDERLAQQTYAEAMTITDDPLLVELFRALLEDERRHEWELVRRYEQFKARLGPRPGAGEPTAEAT